MQLSENSPGYAEIESSDSARAHGNYSDSPKRIEEEEEKKDAFDVRQEINA